MKVFAERLKELREEKQLSMLALGKIIGVSNNAIYTWEHNKNDVKGEQLVKLADYFGVTTDYLLGREN